VRADAVGVDAPGFDRVPGIGQANEPVPVEALVAAARAAAVPNRGFQCRSNEIEHTTVEKLLWIRHARCANGTVCSEVAMYQSNSAHSIELCDHLTARPGGLGRQRTRSILHDHLSQESGLDSRRKPAGLKALANLTFGHTPPRRDNQWLTPWP
jgi:hypothetical protein